ncbi:MAG: HDOD domain-containing protein [Lysobacterales bacterium]
MTATSQGSLTATRRSPLKVNTSGYYSRIFSEIQSGDIPLPSLPHLALQLRTAVRDDNTSFGTISRIIQTDPGVASYLLKLANSPAFASRNKATDLGSAVNRMGTGSLVNVVTTYCLRQLFRSKSPALRVALRNVWVRSAKLGATCAVVAREITRQNADRALLAGLLANVGALPLIRAVSERTPLSESHDVITQIIERYSRQVGVMMLTNWEFDDWLVESVRQYRQWHYVSEEKSSFADLVLVCDFLLNQQELPQSTQPSIQSVPAIQRFSNQWPDTEWTPSLLERLNQQVMETESDLNG